MSSGAKRQRSGHGLMKHKPHVPTRSRALVREVVGSMVMSRMLRSRPERRLAQSHACYGFEQDSRMRKAFEKQSFYLRRSRIFRVPGTFEVIKAGKYHGCNAAPGSTFTDVALNHRFGGRSRWLDQNAALVPVVIFENGVPQPMQSPSST